MKRKSLSGISIFIIAMLLTSCDLAPKPTLSVTDIQNTAFPIVMTQYAQTKAALPTATPIPPTPTATATLAPMPTAALGTPIILPNVNPNATATPDCYQPAPAKLLGTTLKLNLINKSGGPVSPLSMGMYKPNDQGECYTFTFSLRDKQTVLIKILSGCYWISGYQNGTKPSTPRTDYICFTSDDEMRGLTVGKDSVGYD